jgi:hypothetical protein
MARSQAVAAALIICSFCSCIVQRTDAFCAGLGKTQASLPPLPVRTRARPLVHVIASSRHDIGEASATSRRQVLSASLAAALVLTKPEDCRATDFRKAVEIFGSDGDNPPGLAEQLGSRIGKTLDKNFIDKRRPPPVRLPRTELYKPFAVLLMRSCYDAADALNFVSMEKFQKEFFLLRQVCVLPCCACVHFLVLDWDPEFR